MFKRKPQKTFRVSTSRVYLAGRKGFLRRTLNSMRPYTKRAVYRTQGTLLAL